MGSRTKKAGRRAAGRGAKGDRRGIAAGNPVEAVAAPVPTERPARRGRSGRSRRSRRRSSWQVWLDEVRSRVEGWSLPPPLARFLGAEAPTWVVLLLAVPIIIAGLELTVGVRTGVMPVVDLDYWWHLATGIWILEHGRIPTTDPFSWTYGGDWVAHEWLAAILFAIVDRIAGYAGAIVLVAVVAVAGLFRLTTGMRMYGLSRRAISILVLLWGGVFLHPGVFVVRPQVLTFALFAVLLTELAAYETGRRRSLWLLPPLFALWVNLNLTVLIGGLCLAAFALDRLLRGRLNRHLIIVCALSALALLLNPRGPLLLLTALKYREPDAIRHTYVFEWMAPDFTQLTHLPFLLALPVAPIAAWQLLRLRVWPALPLLFLAYQSFQSIRFIPIYVLLALIFAGWLAWRMSVDSRRDAPAPALFPRAIWTPAVAALAVLLVLTVATRTEASQFRREPIPLAYPEVAATILLEQYPDARLFNVYDYGGFLIHRFAGEQHVYVDGREEMYGDTFLRHYFSLIYGEPGWQEVFDEEGIDAVLIRHIDGLTREMQNSPAWEQVHSDRFSALYVRRAVDAPTSTLGD